MAGLCGVVGDVPALSPLTDDLRWTGEEETAVHEGDGVAIAAVAHPFEAGVTSATTADGGRIVLWGTVWGHDGPEGYEAVEESGADYCAERYDDHGMDFVAGLNGTFVGAVHRPSGAVSLFTDRLGTRPLYYARTDSGVVFSTSIQSLPLHPGVETGFETDFLTEYFALKRPFGVKTPLQGVEQTQPGSVTTVSPGGVEVNRYWEPVYTPRERPREAVVDELADTFREVVADRTSREGDYGLLLSGGSDSRLVLAALDSLDVPVETFHLCDWDNREAGVARRVAEAVDAPFTLLERDRDYQDRQLAAQPRLSNFVGYFNQSHAGGFGDELGAAVDVLLTGHYGDMLFKGNHLRTPGVNLGPLGSFDLPLRKPIEDLETFIDHRADVRLPDYLDVGQDARTVYAANVHRKGSRVIDHGVSYPSLREATLASRCPLTNGTSQFFLHGTAQLLPSGTPFLDNRLLDLFLSIPQGTLLRGDLINEATERLAPELAEIPHGSGLVPVDYPFSLQRAGELATGFAERHVLPDPPEPHWTHGPWPDHYELIRTHDFVRECIDRNEARIRALPFLDWAGVNETYEAHRNGENRMRDLYTLVTFLEMPLHDRL